MTVRGQHQVLELRLPLYGVVLRVTAPEPTAPSAVLIRPPFDQPSAAGSALAVGRSSRSRSSSSSSSSFSPSPLTIITLPALMPRSALHACWLVGTAHRFVNAFGRKLFPSVRARLQRTSQSSLHACPLARDGHHAASADTRKLSPSVPARFRHALRCSEGLARVGQGSGDTNS